MQIHSDQTKPLNGYRRLNIVVASSEVAPFAKTGGLADVCGALPVALSRLGHSVSVIMPAYRRIWQSGQQIETTGVHFTIQIGSKIVPGRLLRGCLPNSDVPIYFVEQTDYFDRPELYGEDGRDYKDNCERFVFFCRAVMDAIRQLNLKPDVLHANDWQTGLLPAYLNIEHRDMPDLQQTISLLTIHNLAYQGVFWHWDMLLSGLDWKYFNWRQMEYFGDLNLLKTGIVFADALTTVSPRYATEIQQHELGCGLDGVLRERRDVLTGIVNGVDYDVWNPATDKNLATNYDVQTWSQGKAECKAALQREVELLQSSDTPLIGIVGRLAEQKGWNLLEEFLRDWARHEDVQWVILGTGEPQYHELLTRITSERPDKVAARLTFSDPLAHRIEAGADMFLMPSRFEPCGLNQLYSLRYGTVPVVRSVGGLADTITNASPENIESGTANGFSFEQFDAESLVGTLRRACDTYRNQPDVWSKLVTTGMKQDWSWNKSARQYVELYEQTIGRRRKSSVH